MILVDKDIRKRISQDKLIVDDYADGELLNCVSYDLTVSKIICNKESQAVNYQLQPGEFIFVKTEQKLNMPYDLLGVVTEKNSRMRQGLKVDAPRYHPGHSTYMFLRVQNISNDMINISKGMKIAQIMFETLSDKPDVPYNFQEKSSFNDEDEYRGCGNYSEEYSREVKSLDASIKKAQEDIESVSHRIYSNVLALMGIIVAVFSLITINYNAATQQALNFKFLIAMNLSLGFCIVLLMGLIFLFINTKKNKALWIVYLSVFILLAISVVVFSIQCF